ncbi:DUF5110 domain-containing protein [Nonomuraea sp. NPDC050680]|uniref:DUF5110 domain-containing protein n=1 Tax=Nonomuraea sp. NPDC050680 TaxID=3154630 RepID=UPI0033FB3875
MDKRTDSTTRNELVARVYAGPAASNSTLYEDDGATTGYQSGAVRTTLLSQQLSGSTANFPDTADQWRSGGNSTFTSPASGAGGTTTGAF